MRRVQSVAVVFAFVCGALALVTSTGCPVLPEGDPGSVGLLHSLVGAVGGICGFFLPFRAREIDQERWRIVEDTTLTSGEREYAHKEADSERKTAGTIFLVAPLTLGLWLAYQFRQEDAIVATDFLAVTPLVGFAVGWLVGWAWLGRSRSGPL